VSPPDPIFGGQGYHVVLQIHPPGSDVRFGVLDRDIAIGYAPIYVNTNWAKLDRVWLVAGGVGVDHIDGGTNYWWGVGGFWPDGTKRLRWGWSGDGTCIPDYHYFIWRFDQCASSDGDSGYAAFAPDGRYLGPITGGCDNPTTIGCPSSSGKLAGTYLEWVKDFLPGVTNAPPLPRAVTVLNVQRN
jgi:hypothetical protein